MRFARAAVFMKFRGSRENIFSHSCLHATWRRRNVCPLLSDRETNRDSFISVSLSFFFYYLVSSTRYCVCPFSRGYLEFCRINRRRSVFVEFFEGEEIWPWIKDDYFVHRFSLVSFFETKCASSVRCGFCVYIYVYV